MALDQRLVQLAAPHTQLSSSSTQCQSASTGRGGTSIAGDLFSSSLWCLCAGSSSSRHVPPALSSGRKMATHELWREFFADPSQWWDNRVEKVNSRYPDFTHKKAEQALWLDNSLTPSWVEAELAAIAPGTLHSDIFSWNASLRRHVKAGDYRTTLDVFQQMRREGMTLDRFTFVPVLKACSSLRNIEEGRRVHEQIIQTGCEADDHVATCLVDMYAKCGRVDDAWTVFNKMQQHDVVSWNVMIGGYVKAGQGLKAMELFRQMKQEGVEPSPVTFVGVLNACAAVVALEEGRRVHGDIIRRRCDSNIHVATCLVDMYAKCGSIEDSWSVFKKMQKRNVVSWNAMIGGIVKSGKRLKPMALLRKMQQEVEPDTVTFAGLLSLCSSIMALEEGRYVHEEILRKGYESDVYVSNCLVDMYAKCGSMEDAWSVFNKMSVRDVVSWNAMIGGCLKSGQGLQTASFLNKMEQEGIEPDKVTFVGLLNSCATTAALEEGRSVHKQIIQRGLEFDVLVANCLVNMYAKCGSIEDAWSVFNNMPEQDVVSWNAMIAGYAMHGHAKTAIELFRRMHKEGIEINGITFTCLLSACSHGGLVKEGLRYFKFMISCHNILPSTEHYSGMVDLLGRAGRLEEAEEMMNRIPMEKNSSAWMSLLGACRNHGNIEIGERIAKRCWELEPQNASGHVLLSHIYAIATTGEEKL